LLRFCQIGGRPIIKKYDSFTVSDTALSLNGATKRGCNTWPRIKASYAACNTADSHTDDVVSKEVVEEDVGEGGGAREELINAYVFKACSRNKHDAAVWHDNLKALLAREA